jgi:hypothetical protein
MSWVQKLFDAFRSLGASQDVVGEQPRIDTNCSGKPPGSVFKTTVERITSALRNIPRHEGVSVLLFTSAPEYFDESDLFEPLQSAVKSVQFAATHEALETCSKTFDLAIVCTHIRKEHKAQYIIRQKRLAQLIVVWCFDNHHSADANLRYNSLADIVLPGHSYCSDFLKTPHSVLGRSFPLPTAQWSRSLASRLLVRNPSLRSNALSGGYVLWSTGGEERKEFLRVLKECIPGNALRLMDPNNREAYFGLSAEERFKDWANYKISLALPLLHDVSFRVFDALLAGQIPLVPTSCYDLDAVVPPNLQQSLPIIRFGEYSPEAVEAACRAGVEKFDKAGAQGIVARHEYARDHHHITSRINAIAEYTKELSTKKLTAVINDSGVGLLAGVPQPHSTPACAKSINGVIDLFDLHSEKVWHGAETTCHGSIVRVITDSAPWSYAAQGALRLGEGPASCGWYWVEVLVDVESGEVGIGIVAPNGQLKGERFVSTRTSTRLIFPFLRGDVALLIRNGRLVGRSAVKVCDLRVYGQPIPDNAYP